MLTRWSRWVADVPDELTSSVVLMNGAGRPDVDHRPRLLERRRRRRAGVCSTAGAGRCRQSSTAGASSASRTSPRSAPIPSSRRPRLVTGGWLATPTGDGIPPAVGATLAAATFAGRRDVARAALLRGPPCRRRRRHRCRGGPGRRWATATARSSLHLVGVVDGRHDAAAHRPPPGRATWTRSARSCRRARYLNVLDGPARAAAAATSYRRRRPAPPSPASRRRVDPDRVLRFGVRPHL